MVELRSVLMTSVKVNWSASLIPPHTLRKAWANEHDLPYFMTNDFNESVEQVSDLIQIIDAQN